MNSKIVMTAFMLIMASGIVAASPFESSFESDFFNTEDSFETSNWFNDDFFADEEDEETQNESSTSEDSFNSDNWFNDDFFGSDETEEQEESNGDSENNETGNGEDESDASEVTEQAYILEAPEPGEEWYEAGSDEWVSYINPRDEYKRDYASYQGEGSGKICVTLLNEEEEVIIGETLPDTQITIPTGESLEWHPHAGPFTVDLPLTENYERPLDSDQFGTSSQVVQGDGYIDSHCLEWHDLAEDATIEYGEVEITGDHADDIHVVGYVQQPHEAWDTNVDPIEDAQSYEETGGEWTMHENGSHGQMVAVLQLDR